MDIKKADLKFDKNKNPYLVVIGVSSKGKEFKKVLSYFDLVHAVKSSIRYENGKKNNDLIGIINATKNETK